MIEVSVASAVMRKRKDEDALEAAAMGRRVAERRKKLNISQAILAKAVGMKQQGIDSIEKGKSGRPGRINEIASALRTSPDWLLFGRGSQVKQKGQFAFLRKPENPHDPHAIAVTVDGRPIGHIARTDAASIRLAGPVQCRAEIIGGWLASGEDGLFGARLDVAMPLTVRDEAAPRKSRRRGSGANQKRESDSL